MKPRIITRQIQLPDGRFVTGYVCAKCPGSLAMTDRLEFMTHVEHHRLARLEVEFKACRVCRRPRPLKMFCMAGRLISICNKCRGGNVGARTGRPPGAIEKHEALNNRVRGLP